VEEEKAISNFLLPIRRSEKKENPSLLIPSNLVSLESTKGEPKGRVKPSQTKKSVYPLEV